MAPDSQPNADDLAAELEAFMSRGVRQGREHEVAGLLALANVRGNAGSSTSPWALTKAIADELKEAFEVFPDDDEQRAMTVLFALGHTAFPRLEDRRRQAADILKHGPKRKFGVGPRTFKDSYEPRYRYRIACELLDREARACAAPGREPAGSVAAATPERQQPQSHERIPLSEPEAREPEASRRLAAGKAKIALLAAGAMTVTVAITIAVVSLVGEPPPGASMPQDVCVSHASDASVVCVRNQGTIVDACDRDPDGHRAYARVITDASRPNFLSPFYDTNDSRMGCGNYDQSSPVRAVAVCVQFEGCSGFKPT